MHLRWSSDEENEGNGWRLVLDEPIEIQKIPAIYIYRPTPAWENTSEIVYEMEWTSTATSATDSGMER